MRCLPALFLTFALHAQPAPGLVFVTTPLAADELTALRDAAPQVEIVQATDREQALAAAPRADGVAAHLLSPEFLRRAEHLRWVHSFSAGVERYVAIPELRDHDRIVLTNARGLYGPAIAEHVFAMLLALLRGLPQDLAHQQQAQWGGDDPPRDCLLGKTMLIVGLGGIGSQVAQRAQAFGMRVVATSRHGQEHPDSVQRVVAADGLDELLPEADVVVVCVPLTDETRGMFDAKRFAAMRKGAYFVNIARGAVCVTDALVETLRSEHLAGAALDVTDPEPLPKDHPLWHMDRVILTPHVAAQAAISETASRDLFRDNLRRFASGEPLRNVVDKRAGY